MACFRDSGSNIGHVGTPTWTMQLCLVMLWLCYAILWRFEQGEFVLKRLEPFAEGHEGFFGVNKGSRQPHEKMHAKAEARLWQYITGRKGLVFHSERHETAWATGH
jgi:hypothetical protein